MQLYNVKPTKSAQERLPRNQIRGLMDDDFERIEEKPVRSVPLSELQKMPEHKVLGSISFNTPAKKEASVPEAFEKGLNESILNPSEPVPQVPNVFQREFATFNLNPIQTENTPRFDILNQASQIAETAWNTLGNAAQDTLEETGGALGEIAEILSGTGEYKPSTPTPETQYSTSHISPSAQELQDTQGLKRPQVQIDALRNTVPLEVFKQLADEALMKNEKRIVGREVSNQEYRDEGHDKRSIAAMVGIENKDSEIKETVEQQEETPISSPAKKEANAAEVEFEGGAGAVGSGGKANFRFGIG